jgi:hypothetical protein
MVRHLGKPLEKLYAQAREETTTVAGIISESAFAV